MNALKICFTHKKYIVMLLLVFVFFVVFFSKIHPLILFDHDDWLNIVQTREAVPIWGGFNPSRVLPEVLMPITTATGAYFINPFLDDFLTSTTIAYAVTVSLFITGYVGCFMYLLRKRFNLSSFSSIMATGVFLLLHFLIFRNAAAGNKYMFYSVDVTCYFYYMIPALLNCSLVMFLIAKNPFKNKVKPVGRALFAALVYLAIFSNLYQSIILASYIGAVLLVDFIIGLKNRKKHWLREFLCNHVVHLVILVMWAIAQIFELNGGRARQVMTDVSFIDSLKETIKCALGIFSKLNILFTVIAVVTLLVGIIIMIRKKIYKNKLFWQGLFAWLLTGVYLVLVCSKTTTYYIGRPDVMFGVVFWVIFVISSVIAYLWSEYKALATTAIILPLIIYCNTQRESNVFMESNILNVPPETCYSISSQIINQIIEADKAGKDHITVYIPKFNDGSNWPIVKEWPWRHSIALRKYGVIKHYIFVTFEYSSEMTSEVDKAYY